MTPPIRIGIVGCGSVMGAYMAQIDKLRADGVVEVTAACDRQEEKRALVRDRYGIEQFTTDYRTLVQWDSVDLVLVLTPMPLHGPVARAALEAGKHVLVEKPMAVTLDEAATLLELARRGPAYLLCAPHVILSPTYQAIWKHIHRGDIGKVLTVRARYGWSGPWWGQWFYQPGGGAMFDLVVYGLTSITGILGPAKRVVALTGVAIPERVVDGEKIRVEAEDNAQILLDFGEAVFASFTTGFTMQQCRGPAYELYGSEGTIQLLGDDWGPMGYEMWRNDIGAWLVYPEKDPHWRWTDGLRHLVECIQKQEKPLITPEHAYHVLEIMIRAQESGRSGRVETLHSTFTPPSFAGEAPHLPHHLVHDRTREEA